MWRAMGDAARVGWTWGLYVDPEVVPATSSHFRSQTDPDLPLVRIQFGAKYTWIYLGESERIVCIDTSRNLCLLCGL